LALCGRTEPCQKPIPPNYFQNAEGVEKMPLIGLKNVSPSERTKMDPRTPLDNTAMYAEWFIVVSPQGTQDA
jgi:hypothetical protein